MKKYLPYVSILLAGTLWGLIGLFNRNLTGFGLSARSIVFLRNMGSLIVLTVLFCCTDRRVFRIRLRHLPYFLGTGIVSVLLFTVCYFTCQQMCSLAVAAVLLYTAPAFVVVLSALLWKDKITKRKLAALCLAFLGCLSVSGVLTGSLKVTAMGLALGVMSGFFYGLYSIFGRYALKHYKPLTVTYYTFLTAGIGSLFIGHPVTTVLAINSCKAIFLVIGLVLVSTIAPYMLYTYGLSRVDSGRASILASVEPVAASLVGVFCFGEPMSGLVLLGLCCILLCVYLLR